MFEVNSLTHTNRYFADKLSWLDIFRPIQYFSYRGDVKTIPWFYKVTKGTSCQTDLTASMDDIFLLMKSNTRNEIRRAQRENIEFALVDNPDEFISYYNAFCVSKGLKDFCSRARLAKFGELLMTKAVHGTETLSMHVNVLNSESKIAFLMFSCSQRLDGDADKKKIGWANRFLHYKELEYLKGMGYTCYDWSGVCTDPNNPQYSIGQFKLSFGGKMVDSIVLRTPLFCLLNLVRKFFFSVRMCGSNLMKRN